MAKILGGSPFGMLSGKLGGNVFSHNRAGQYIRQYVVPVNPATLAQGRARSQFASGSSSYHSLSGAEKSAWGNFAQAVFSPKVGANMGQFSGFNAYTSLKSVVNNGQSINQTVTAQINGGAPTTPLTFNPFAFSNTPPTFALQSNIAGIAGPPQNLNLIGATVGNDGSFSVDIQVGDGAGYNVGDFVDGAGNEFGLLIQCSNSKPQDGMFYDNPYRYTLGYIEHPTVDPTDLTGLQNVELTSTTNINVADYQSFPQIDDYVKLTVYQASTTGMLALLGDIEVQVS